MPFLRAGFNGRNYQTGIWGWTRPVDGHRGYTLAELRRFACGDFFWYGKKFLAWGERCVLGSRNEIELAWEHQYGLPQSELP